MDVNKSIEAVGGGKIKLNSEKLNPLETHSEAEGEYTIEQIINMDLEEKVDWIIKQPLELKKEFLKWKTLVEIKALKEEEEIKLFAKVLKYMPIRMMFNILWDAGIAPKRGDERE